MRPFGSREATREAHTSLIFMFFDLGSSRDRARLCDYGASSATLNLYLETPNLIQNNRYLVYAVLQDSKMNQFFFFQLIIAVSERRPNELQASHK